MNMQLQEVLDELRSVSDSKVLEGMSNFGINNQTALGIKVPILRAIAKRIKKDHQLAQQLWETNIHEARLIALFVADIKQLSEAKIESWLKDFNSWDICDQFCRVFCAHPLAYSKALEWTERAAEFEKRTGFSLMAYLAVHDKKADDLKLIQFFPVMEREASDSRNFVKKAVNWALRQIGKRNGNLKHLAIQTAERIHEQNTPSAKWIAADALRELRRL